MATREVFLVPDHEEDMKLPQFRIGDFHGPLDLLIYLIEKHEIDLFDIPLASLTEQYLKYLEDLEGLDMDIASDFLLMGASLIELKSRMILPQDENNLSEDPREELVLRLLAYRRCKLIAEELKQREQLYSGVYFRLPENPKNLGILAADRTENYADESEFRSKKFDIALKKVSDRNQARFQDLSEKMEYIVSRETLNLKDWITNLWTKLKVKAKLSFNQLFPAKSGSSQRLTGFLAVLELLKQNSIEAKQEEPFADIIITRSKEDNA